MFWNSVDKGYHPEDIHGDVDSVPEKTTNTRGESTSNGDHPMVCTKSDTGNPIETQLERLVRERKERLNATHK